MLAGVLVAAFCAYQGASQSHQTTKPIEQLRVGQKVVTDAPSEALAAAAAGELSSLSAHDEPTVDPATWKLVRLRAEQRWDDGTLDDINVETLQPPEWLAEHNVRVGGEVPLPLDLVEMGLPMDLQAKVLGIERCPPLEAGPGRTVLTTVNHLNRDVVELTIRDAQGREETMRPTGLHKFYSATHNEWLSAADLQLGEQLDGLIGLHTVVALRHFPGTHRVYNMTVEGEHVYRVSGPGILVHNNGCTIGLGFEKHLESLRRNFGAVTYEEWGSRFHTWNADAGLTEFMAAFNKSTKKSEKIVFSLDDFEFAKAFREGTKLPDPAKRNLTSWEFMQIWNNKELLSKTDFVRGNQIVNVFDEMARQGFHPPY